MHSQIIVVNDTVAKVALITATLHMVTATMTTIVALPPLTQRLRSAAPIFPVVAVADGHSEATTEFPTKMSAAPFVVQGSGGIHARDERGEK